MSNNGKLECVGLEEIISDNFQGLENAVFKKFELAVLDPEQCCFVKIYFCPLKPGKYKIRASITYNEGKLKIIETSTVVEPKIVAKINIACIIISYTLMRLSLAFNMGTN